MSTDVIQESKPAVIELTANDRCIGCGAQAYVKAETLTLGEFLFCLHHWTKNKDKIEPLSMHVQDETHKLLPQPYNPETDNS